MLIVVASIVTGVVVSKNNKDSSSDPKSKEELANMYANKSFYMDATFYATPNNEWKGSGALIESCNDFVTQYETATGNTGEWAYVVIQNSLLDVASMNTLLYCVATSNRKNMLGYAAIAFAEWERLDGDLD